MSIIQPPTFPFVLADAIRWSKHDELDRALRDDKICLQLLQWKDHHPHFAEENPLIRRLIYQLYKNRSDGTIPQTYLKVDRTFLKEFKEDTKYSPLYESPENVENQLRLFGPRNYPPFWKILFEFLEVGLISPTYLLQMITLLTTHEFLSLFSTTAFSLLNSMAPLFSCTHKKHGPQLWEAGLNDGISECIWFEKMTQIFEHQQEKYEDPSIYIDFAIEHWDIAPFRHKILIAFCKTAIGRHSSPQMKRLAGRIAKAYPAIAVRLVRQQKLLPVALESIRSSYFPDQYKYNPHKTLEVLSELVITGSNHFFLHRVMPVLNKSAKRYPRETLRILEEFYSSHFEGHPIKLGLLLTKFYRKDPINLLPLLEHLSDWWAKTLPFNVIAETIENACTTRPKKILKIIQNILSHKCDATIIVPLAHLLATILVSHPLNTEIEKTLLIPDGEGTSLFVHLMLEIEAAPCKHFLDEMLFYPSLMKNLCEKSLAEGISLIEQKKIFYKILAAFKAVRKEPLHQLFILQVMTQQHPNLMFDCIQSANNLEIRKSLFPLVRILWHKPETASKIPSLLYEPLFRETVDPHDWTVITKMIEENVKDCL